MKKEQQVLNLICILVALALVAFAVVNALTSGDLLSTDNLFITMVCLVLALMFAVNPLFYLSSQGKLPIPFVKKASPAASASTSSRISGSTSAPRIPASNPPLLDAKGRAVPPDVRAMMARMGKTEPKDA